MHKVVVTGIGMITPIGATARESADAWRAGAEVRREVLPALCDTSLADQQVAVLPEFSPKERLGSRRMLKFMSPSAVLGAVAAHDAATEADISQRFAAERIGLYAATGLAAANIDEVAPVIERSIDDGQFSCRRLGEQGLSAANPLLAFKILANTPPCLVSIIESVKGPNVIFTPWEGHAATALLEAWRAVATDEVDCALTGAADYASQAPTVVYLKQAGLLADGEYPAAAAAYLVLEREATALRDGRRIYAYINYVEVRRDDGPVDDPLSARIGRTYAAAPLVMLGMACQGADMRLSLRGVDGQRFSAEVEVLP